MNRKTIFCAALLAVVPSAAVAAGINLSWDDCGTFGTLSRTFACNTNSGTNTMVGSFVAPAGVYEYLSCESELEIQTSSATLPDWWKFKNTGTCRLASLTLSGDFTAGPFNCTDFFAGRAAGGIGAYDIAYFGPNRSHIKLVLSVSTANRGWLNEGEQYYAYKLSFNNAKSVGTGSCAGCAIGACINTRYIKLVQQSGLNDNRLISHPWDRAFVLWQSLNDNLCQITPTRRTTWGALKSLYR